MRVFKYKTEHLSVKKAIEKKHFVEVEFEGKDTWGGITKEEFFYSPDHKKVKMILDDIYLEFKFKDIISKERRDIILRRLVDSLAVVLCMSKDQIFNDLVLYDTPLDNYFPPVFSRFLTPRLVEKVDIYNLIVKKFFKCCNCKQFLVGHRPKNIVNFDKPVIPFSGQCHIDVYAENGRELQTSMVYSNRCCMFFKPVKLVEKRIIFRIYKEINKLEEKPFKFPKNTPKAHKKGNNYLKEYSQYDYREDLKNVNFCKFIQNEYEREKTKVITLYVEDPNKFPEKTIW